MSDHLGAPSDRVSGKELVEQPYDDPRQPDYYLSQGRPGKLSPVAVFK